MVEPTHLKHASQIGSFPQGSGWKQKYLKPPPSVWSYIYTQKYIIHLHTLQTRSQLDENPMILEKLPSNQNWCRYHSISEPNLAPTRFKSPSSIYLKMLLLEKQGQVGQGNPRTPTISSRLCNAIVHWHAFSPRSFLASFNWKWTREVRRYLLVKASKTYFTTGWKELKHGE